MKKALLLAAILLALAGCATTANYEKMLDAWIGSTELDLVRKWGPPQQTYETGGRRFLVYRSSRLVFIPGAPASYTTTIMGNTAYTTRVGGVPSQYMVVSCQTTFEIADDKVMSWNWQGNDCKALD